MTEPSRKDKESKERDRDVQESMTQTQPAELSANSLGIRPSDPFLSCLLHIITCCLHLAMARYSHTLNGKSLGELPGLKEKDVL